MKTENQLHVLNGDALRQQFPESVGGKQVVCRECLVVGDLEGETLQAFYETRARYLSENYGGTRDDYFKKVVPNFETIAETPPTTEINLWFEEDLFCQVNCWFVLHLLVQNHHENIFLVRPTTLSPYGFAAYNQEELATLLLQRIRLDNLELLAQLWPQYKANNTKQLQEVASLVSATYPFIANAVQAYIQSIPTKDSLGVPSETLIAISKALKTNHFGTIFKEFCRQLPIYGYGDLQVKQLYDSLLQQGLL